MKPAKPLTHFHPNLMVDEVARGRRRSVAWAGVALASVVAACGTGAETVFEQPDAGHSPDANAKIDPLTPAGDAAPKDGGLEACATSRGEAQRMPLHIVVMLDKSGSMCIFDPAKTAAADRDCANPASRWQLLTKAMKGFFEGKTSTGIQASLVPFPKANAMCVVDSYKTPLFQDKALPDNTIYAQMTATVPSPGMLTPTRDVMTGSYDFAKRLRTQTKGEKVVLLMATDGKPEGCSSTGEPDGDVGPASLVAAAAAADTIETYVIGVSDNVQSLQNLDLLASKGGTTKAQLVDVNNPQQAAIDLAAALDKIRIQAVGCTLKLPAAPDGKTLDYDKVNVTYTAKGGGTETLVYSPTCSDPRGWRYDVPAAPTEIELCGTVCTDAKNDPDAKVELVLGCVTVGLPVK